MPFKNVLPVPKIYSKKLSENTMKYYAWLISKNYFFPICYFCGKEYKKFNLHIHHKNKNRWDNRICNLLPLCPKCHFKADFPKGRPSWFKGHHHSLQTKDILSFQHLGKKLTLQHRKAISSGMMGLKFTDAHKINLSLSLRKYYSNKNEVVNENV